MTCTCDNSFGSNKSDEHYDNCQLQWSKTRSEPWPRNNDGSIRLPNPHLKDLECDTLYHLGLSTDTHDFVALFEDVKVVCTGGTEQRMRDLAEYLYQVLDIKKDPSALVNLIKKGGRYAMYKVGPVLCVNHGIGIASMSVLVQEIFKLLHYAKAKDPVIIRVGTSGGVSIEPGTVVVTECALNGCLNQTYDLPILGKVQQLPAKLDRRLARELASCSMDDDGFATVLAGTLAVDDFYRGQARLDGPICRYTSKDKMNFLTQLCDAGVRNIEMEATAFGALTYEAGIRSAIVCVTLLDRFKGDQVTTPKETLTQWQERPMLIVGRYIAQIIGNTKQ